MSKHARLSPSRSLIYLKCTKAIEEMEARPKQEETEAMRRGTLAHRVAELALNGAKRMPKEVTSNPLYDAVMRKCATDYVKYIQALGGTVQVEQTVSLEQWAPGSFGTADCIVTTPNAVHIIDYKYGYTYVPVKGNSQLYMYALGALAALPLLPMDTLVTLTIYQPRLKNISRIESTVQDILNWGATVLKPAADAITSGNTSATPGPHCTKCPALGECKASSSYIQNQLVLDQAVNTLSTAQIVEVLRMTKTINAWLTAVGIFAVEHHMSAEENRLPGFKLMIGRKAPTLADPNNEVFDYFNWSVYDVFNPRTLKTVKQLEAILPPDVYQKYVAPKVFQPIGEPTLRFVGSDD